MAAKAALLGVVLIASRTSPTDMAVEICEDAGIVLLGYVRGRRFNVYAHPERLCVPAACERIADVTGVILAGGSSTRMGSNKALLPYQGGTFIESIHRRMAALFREVIVVTNTPDLFRFMPCPKVADIIPGMGGLSGTFWLKRWPILTSGSLASGQYNMMTVGWGGIGAMWRSITNWRARSVNAAITSLSRPPPPSRPGKSPATSRP